MKRWLVFVALLILIGPIKTYAYSEATTHPALTGEIINFYKLTGGELTAEEAGWVIEGSKFEDTPPRWINHFYDPVNKTGWTGAHAGNIPESAVRSLSSIGLSSAEPLSAVDWVNNYSAQEAYGPYGGNRTWQRGLEYFADGDKKEAFITLGHTLHLAEDMTVPDHTRDDTHAQDLGGITGDEGSPYEQYTARWNPDSIKSLNISGSLTASGATPIKMGAIADYLTSLAAYSNKYFFSKDTINDPRYSLPKILRDDGHLGYSVDESGAEFPIVLSTQLAEYGENKKIYSLKRSEEYYPILDAYFTRLSRQAVLNGAGIIGLFKSQADDAAVNAEFHVSDIDAMRKLTRNAGHIFALPTFSLTGILAKLKNGATVVIGSVANTTQSAFNFLAGLFNRNGNTASPTTDDINLLADLNAETDTPDQNGQDNSGPLPSPAPFINTSLSGATSAVPATIANIPTSTKRVIKLPYFLRSTTSTVGAVGANPGISTTTVILVRLTLPPFIGGSSPSGSGGGGSNSTAGAVLADSTSTSAATSTVTDSASHIVISEILFDADGSDTGKEFIELYNPKDAAEDLAGWSLKYRTDSSTTTHTLALFHTTTSTGDNSIVPPRGFLLIGLNSYDPVNYEGISADITRSAALPNGEEKTNIYLYDKAKIQIDTLSYDSTYTPSAGHSLERKAAGEAECASSQDNGEFLGNGCPENIFEPRKTPNPQNSSNLPEPREAPTAPAGLDGSPILAYDKNSPALNFAWQESKDTEGSSTIVYELFDVSTSSPILVATTTATSTNIGINEVGRDYDFALFAKDRDGLRSATTSPSINIPDYLDNIYFYKDPRVPAGTNYIFDLRYSSRPFIPPIKNGGRLSWQALIFYLNRPANTGNSALYGGKSYVPGNKDGVISIGQNGAVIFGLSPGFSGQPASTGGLFSSSFLLPEEDNRLVLDSGLTSPTSTDYITVAYYDFWNDGSREENLALVTIDNKKIFLSDPPENTPPTVPQNLDFSFDQIKMELTASWASSTDPDSPDNKITYEINYSTSTELSSSTWLSVGSALNTKVPLIFGNEYFIGVRAVDDFGKASEPQTKSWKFPDGFAPIEPLIGNFGESRCYSKDIYPNQRIKIATVEYNAKCYDGACNPPNVFEIFDSSSTLLAQSNGGSSYFGYPDPSHVSQNFSGMNQIIFEPGQTYYVSPRSTQGTCAVSGEFKITGIAP